MTILANLSACCLGKGDLAKAEEYALMQIPMAQELHWEVGELIASRTLSEVYTKAGNLGKALHFAKELLSISKRV